MLIPALLASLASSFLPVSNLTNLIVAEQLGLAPSSFLVQLGPPTVVAVAVGWWRYRAVVASRLPVTVGAGREAVAADDGPPRGPGIGAAVVVFVLVGFTLGDSLGVPAWVGGPRRRPGPDRRRPPGALALGAGAGRGVRLDAGRGRPGGGASPAARPLAPRLGPAR